MPLTTYGQNRLNDHLFGNTVYTPPTLKLSLHTAGPGAAGSHAAEVSTSGSAYARQPLATLMGASSDGVSVNTAAINFGPATSNWGTINYVAIEDETNSQMIWYGAAAPPRTVNDGLPFQIAAGQIRARLS